MKGPELSEQWPHSLPQLHLGEQDADGAIPVDEEVGALSARPAVPPTLRSLRLHADGVDHAERHENVLGRQVIEWATGQAREQTANWIVPVSTWRASKSSNAVVTWLTLPQCVTQLEGLGLTTS